jgi:hypothetical protein
MGERETVEAMRKAARDHMQSIVQLAACGVAAGGGTSPSQVATEGQYGWSPAYQAVLNLRNDYDRVESCLKAEAEAKRIAAGPSLDYISGAVEDFTAGRISVGKFGELLGAKDLHAFKLRCHADCDTRESEPRSEVKP